MHIFLISLKSLNRVSLYFGYDKRRLGLPQSLVLPGLYSACVIVCVVFFFF